MYIIAQAYLRCCGVAKTEYYPALAAAILDFRNLKLLTVGTVKKLELRHYAKFRRNRSNRGRGIAILQFFKMAAAAILDFKNFKFLTVGTGQHATRPSYPTIRSTDIRVLFYFIVNNSFIY